MTGSDQHVYPPMSDQLREAGIVLYEGYDPAILSSDLDLAVIGNAMSASPWLGRSLTVVHSFLVPNYLGV